jgi:hypothetical protein
MEEKVNKNTKKEGQQKERRNENKRKKEGN